MADKLIDIWNNDQVKTGLATVGAIIVGYYTLKVAYSTVQCK